MTFRTTLQDLDVEVTYNEKGEIDDVQVVTERPSGSILEVLRLAAPKHIKDLHQEASQHLQEEERDPENSYDSRM